MRLLIVAPVIGVVFALTCLTAASAEEPAVKPIKPCVVITGADSRVETPRYLRITSADDWARVWQEHKEKKPTRKYDLYYDPLTLPVIDFDAYMVIAIFQGSSWNRTGLRADSISEEADRIVFRFDEKSYQTGGPPGEAKANKVSVYGFFILSRSTKPVVLEEDVQQYLNQPPVWKERIIFPEMKEN